MHIVIKSAGNRNLEQALQTRGKELMGQQRPSRPTVAIIVPLFNEADVIEPFLSRLCKVVNGEEGYRFRLIFVDDGSTDETLSKLLSARETLAPNDVLILELSRNFGKEAAITAGLDAFEDDACIIIDADLQDPPEIFGAFLTRWKEGYEVVATRRNDRVSDSFIKRSTAKLFYWVNGLTSDINIPENVGDCRLMDRMVVDALKRLPENRRFMKGLFAWVGFRTSIIDVTRDPRASGRSKFSLLRLISFAIDGLTSFSTSLLRLWTFAGLFVSFYAILHAIYVFARVFYLGIETPGFATIALLLLFFGGVQMVGLGIIGEYVGRTYYEAKRRPSYIVRRTYGTADNA